MGAFDWTMLVPAALAMWLAWLLAPRFVGRRHESLRAVSEFARADWIAVAVVLVSSAVVALAAAFVNPLSLYAEICLLPLAPIALVLSGAYLRLSPRLIAVLTGAILAGLLLMSAIGGWMSFIALNGSTLAGVPGVWFGLLADAWWTGLDLTIRCGICLLAGNLVVVLWERRSDRVGATESL